VGWVVKEFYSPLPYVKAVLQRYGSDGHIRAGLAASPGRFCEVCGQSPLKWGLLITTFSGHWWCGFGLVSKCLTAFYYATSTRCADGAVRVWEVEACLI